MLDDGLRMYLGLWIAGELAHRRRTAEPPGARGDLGHDLLVRVALADPALELRKLLRIDRSECPVAGLFCHTKNGRADCRIRK